MESETMKQAVAWGVIGAVAFALVGGMVGAVMHDNDFALAFAVTVAGLVIYLALAWAVCVVSE